MARISQSKLGFARVGVLVPLPLFAGCVGDEENSFASEAGGTSADGSGGTAGMTVPGLTCIPPSIGGVTGAVNAGSVPGPSPTWDGGGIGGGGGGEPQVRLEGRFDLTDPTKPAFGWSGSAMVARFQGTGATLHINGSPNQFAVVVDFRHVRRYS
jgi:hypothetical protein